jgi:hypothetical protein
MILDMEVSPYSGKETGETALLRKMLAGVNPGDVLVADRYYCAFFSIAILLARGADMVTRLHHKRSPEDGRRERLGDGDWLVDWHLPAQPSWMDDETYARMPRKMPLRVIDVRVARKGYRTRSFHVVTTLLDHVEYPADDIRALYAKRWLVELDIRSIKSTMNFDVLRRETPEGARTELWTGVLAYNLIRQTMLQAAFIAGRNPREMSFAHALQSVKASWGTMILLSPEVAQRMSWALIAGIATVLVGQRPHRTEPRAVKRRPKPHALLKKTREEARAELLQGLV